MSRAKSATAPIRKIPEQLLIWSIYKIYNIINNINFKIYLMICNDPWCDIHCI